MAGTARPTLRQKLPNLQYYVYTIYLSLSPHRHASFSPLINTTARHELFWDYFMIINRNISIKNAVLILYRAVVLSILQKVKLP